MAKDEINAFLGAGTKYEGKLNFEGSVRIDGDFTGEIKSEGTLIVGKDANVQGEVAVGQMILSGKFEGEINAGKKVVLHKTANLLGSMHTPSLVIEEGAVLQGQVSMGNDASAGKSSGKTFGAKGKSAKTEGTYSSADNEKNSETIS